MRSILYTAFKAAVRPQVIDEAASCLAVHP
jgi:hypothetical protein